MLKIINSEVLQTPAQIERDYPGCMCLFTGAYDVNDPKGYLYAVSTDSSTMHDMCVLAKELSDKGIQCSFAGSFSRRGTVYV